MPATRRTLSMGVAGAVLAMAMLSGVASSTTATDRSSSVELDAETATRYGEELRAVATALYDEYVLRTGTPRSDPAEAVADLSRQFPMTKEAQATLSAYASRLQLLGDPAAAPKVNFVLPVVTKVTVTPTQITASRPANSDLVVDVETLIVTEYNEGPPTEELISYLVTKDPNTGVYTSFVAMDQWEWLEQHSDGRALTPEELEEAEISSDPEPDFTGPTAPPKEATRAPFRQVEDPSS